MYLLKNPEIMSQKLDKEHESCSKWLIELSHHLGKIEAILFGLTRELSKTRYFDDRTASI